MGRIEIRDEPIFCNPVGIIVRNMEGLRVRKESDVSCMKPNGGNIGVCYVYKCHTEVKLHLKKN